MKGAFVVLAVVAVWLAACNDGSATTETEEAVREVQTSSTSETSTTRVQMVASIATGDIPYTDGQVLDVYAPDEPGPWPVVVVAHGYGQTKLQYRELAEAVASQGAVVYNANVEIQPPFLTSIEQLVCVVRFAHATADQYGGDASRLVFFGDSASAASGVLVGFAGEEYDVAGCVVGPDESVAIDAIVGYEGVYDRAIVERGAGGVVELQERDPDLWAAVDPYSHIGSNPELVIRLIHGQDMDATRWDIPPEASIDFHQALLDAGYDTELILVEGAAHDALARGRDGPSDAFAITVSQVMARATS